jgi:hypothetical protein
MARTRYTKPEFFTDEDLCAFPPLHRLLYQGLWLYEDRDGRLEDKPRELKFKVLPYDDCDVDSMLQDFADAGFLVRYRGPNGKRYLCTPTMPVHQKFHCDEKPRGLPAPPQELLDRAQALRRGWPPPVLPAHLSSTGSAPCPHCASTLPAPGWHPAPPAPAEVAAPQATENTLHPVSTGPAPGLHRVSPLPAALVTETETETETWTETETRPTAHPVGDEDDWEELLPEDDASGPAPMPAPTHGAAAASPELSSGLSDPEFWMALQDLRVGVMAYRGHAVIPEYPPGDFSAWLEGAVASWVQRGLGDRDAVLRAIYAAWEPYQHSPEATDERRKPVGAWDYFAGTARSRKEGEAPPWERYIGRKGRGGRLTKVTQAMLRPPAPGVGVPGGR